MGYLDTYRTRLQASGSNSTDGIVFSSKNTIKNNFSNSLFSELVLIDDVEYEVIPTQEEKSEDKKILLKPDTKIDIGAVVKMNELNYLVTDFLGEGINEIYPAATLKLCNSTFPIQSNKTRVLIGTDPRTGRPLYDEQDGTITNEPCIAETSYSLSNSSDSKNLMIPEGRIIITIKYQVVDSLALNYEFTMYDTKYKITDFDLTKADTVNNKGIMKIIAEKVV